MSTAALVSKWSDREVLAGTIVGEASAELYGGQVAVACVVRNRVRNPRWWGVGWRSVCIKDWMFSCWKDQQRRIALNREHNSPAWRQAMAIAGDVIADRLPDVTLNSDHYLNERVVLATAGKLPGWMFVGAVKRTPVIRIGAHDFHRLELRP
jgi:spore germination cell wall hydrolase CwlJ-like protein